MAKADYICCDSCDEKLIYDSSDLVIEALEWRLTGSHEHKTDVLDILCEKCSGHGGIIIRRKEDEANAD